MTSCEEQPYLVAFGARLRQARAAAGWTQATLAARLGLTRSSVANFEGARQHPPVAVAALCAEVLLCDPGWLLTGRTQAPYPALPLLGHAELVDAAAAAQQLHRRLHDLASRLDAQHVTTGETLQQPLLHLE